MVTSDVEKAARSDGRFWYYLTSPREPDSASAPVNLWLLSFDCRRSPCGDALRTVATALEGKNAWVIVEVRVVHVNVLYLERQSCRSSRTIPHRDERQDHVLLDNGWTLKRVLYSGEQIGSYGSRLLKAYHFCSRSSHFGFVPLSPQEAIVSTYVDFAIELSDELVGLIAEANFWS